MSDENKKKFSRRSMIASLVTGGVAGAASGEWVGSNENLLRNPGAMDISTMVRMQEETLKEIAAEGLDRDCAQKAIDRFIDKCLQAQLETPQGEPRELNAPDMPTLQRVRAQREAAAKENSRNA